MDHLSRLRTERRSRIWHTSAGLFRCGITDGTVTSMQQELGKAPSMDESSYFWRLNFRGFFAMYAVHVDEQTQLA